MRVKRYFSDYIVHNLLLFLNIHRMFSSLCQKLGSFLLFWKQLFHHAGSQETERVVTSGFWEPVFSLRFSFIRRDCYLSDING